MTLSNLSILILATAVALFITSQFARRAGHKNPMLQFLVKALIVVVLLLAAVYFYKKFAA